MILYNCIVGSRLYGMARENSDTDTLEVRAPTTEELFGLARKDYSRHFRNPLGDVHQKSLHDFLYTLYKGAPNIIEALFAPEDKVIRVHPVFKQYILERRDLFVSANMRPKIVGFATSSIKRGSLHGDPKELVHAIRITRQGVDWALHGRVEFPLPYAEELLDMYNWEIPRLVEAAESSLNDFKAVEYRLSRELDYRIVNNLAIEMTKELLLYDQI